MGLIDKLKNTEESAKLKSEVIKETIKQESKDSDQNITNSKFDENSINDFVIGFLKNYDKSKKQSRMIRLQDDNFEELVQLKIHNISISKFVNLAIHKTLKSKDFKQILKSLNNNR